MNLYLVLCDLLTDLLQISLGENHPHISLNQTNPINKSKHRTINTKTNQIWKENKGHTTRRGRRLSNALFPVFSAWSLMQRRIRVFLPMSTTESPRSPCLMFCIWFDPTLSAATIKTWVYSFSKRQSFLSYCTFFSALESLIAIAKRSNKESGEDSEGQNEPRVSSRWNGELRRLFNLKL